MHNNADVLGGEGRKALDACVKVKILGKPENTLKYHWHTAFERLRKCYAGRYPLRLQQLGDYAHLLLLPRELETTLFDIVDIHDALVNFDAMRYVEKYPKPGHGSDRLKQDIDKRRAGIEKEYQEAIAEPDGRRRYPWLVAQRRVRDCFAGNFAGDSLILQDNVWFSHGCDPNKLYHISDIHDAIVQIDEAVRLHEMSYVQKYPSGNTSVLKEIDARRADIEREMKEAISNPEELKEYSSDEAGERLRRCFYELCFPNNVDLLSRFWNEMPNLTQTYNIFDIHKALKVHREGIFEEPLQIFPKDEEPGSDELKKSIKSHRNGVEKENQEATRGLRRYSLAEAECMVRSCFASEVLRETEIFPIKEGESTEPNFTIFDIHRRFLHFDKRKWNSIMPKFPELAEAHRKVIQKEYQKATSRLPKYSRNEADHRVRDCFAGPRPDDTDIFPSRGEESGIPKIHQTYDISEIKNAVDFFDEKRLCDKYLDENVPNSKHMNQLVDDTRAEIEREYAEATKEVEIEHGSGFIIHEHFIITNKHVIEDAAYDQTMSKEIMISNASIGELPCEIAHDDARKDLALLYCQGLDLKQSEICPLQLSDQSLLPGLQIFSVGFPMSHRGQKPLFVNGYVSGFKEMDGYGQLCSLHHTMAVLNCSLNFGNSGGPILCWVKGQLKVVGVAAQKHFKEILTLDERVRIEKIRESLQTSSITSVADNETPMVLLTLKLYDALETHSQFNLSNALPGHCVIEFIRECISRYNGEWKEELADVVKLSEC